MGSRGRRTRRALEVGRVARRGRLLRVLAEVGAVGDRPATREGARAFREGLEELGTTFIKLGQMLSSRPDLLPDLYIAELEQLVDDVPPFPFEEARRIVDEEIGLEIFARLDEQPLACASIAQIHGGLLRTGREVVVKIRRPGIEQEVALDLELLRSLTSFAEGRSEKARLLQLAALADELETHLLSELDFVEEAHGSELIGRIVADAEHLVVPAVIHPYVTEKVLVQERVTGERVTRDHGLDPERAAVLARELFGVYVAADHRLRRLPRRSAPRQHPPDRRRSARSARLRPRRPPRRRHAAGARPAPAGARAEPSRRRCRLHPRALPDHARLRRGRLRPRAAPQASALPLAPALTGIGAGEALADLQRVALRHGISLPTGFALVGKTLAQADSVARALDPELDPIELFEEDGIEVMLRETERTLEPANLLALAYTQAEPLLRLPRRLGQLASRLETGTLKVGIQPTGLHELEHVARSVANRLGAAMIISALLVASALMARVNDTIAIVGFALSVSLGLFELWRILRTPGDL